MDFRNRRGYTLIELLIVVAIIGIIAAIAIPNLLNAINRSKQKRTMADMRTIAVAWESRHSEVGTYMAAGSLSTFVWPTSALAYTDLLGLITPTYVRNLPQYDGWNNAFQFGVRDPDIDIQMYAIRSGGKDGVFNSDTYPEGGTALYDCDLVYSNGRFAVYPEGVQTD